jgi:Amt family ammonium transporter
LYLWEHWLRLDDPSGSAAAFGLPGLWGLVALAVFADGGWGAGWNGVGPQQYRGIAGQGVSGLILAPGFQPNGSAQLYAQLAGVGALLVVALLVPWLIFKAALWVGSLGRETAPDAVPAAAEPSAEQAAPDPSPEQPTSSGGEGA